MGKITVVSRPFALIFWYWRYNSSTLDYPCFMLPPSSYTLETIFQKEMEMLFRDGPNYIGHTGLVPEVGDYMTLKQEYEGRMLVHTPQ